MKLTSKGRRALEAARLLWSQVQDKVLRELGTKAWADAQRRLAHLLRVAVKRRGPSRGRSRVQPSPARRGAGPGAGGRKYCRAMGCGQGGWRARWRQCP